MQLQCLITLARGLQTQFWGKQLLLLESCSSQLSNKKRTIEIGQMLLLPEPKQCRGLLVLAESTWWHLVAGGYAQDTPRCALDTRLSVFDSLSCLYELGRGVYLHP